MISLHRPVEIHSMTLSGETASEMLVHTYSHMPFAYFHSSWGGEGVLSLFLLNYLRVNFVSLLCFSFIEKERKGVSVLKVFSRVVNTAVILTSPTAEETDRRERGGGGTF